MAYSYHYVDLSTEQLQRRRRLLDGYGQFAQLSVLLLPLIYHISKGIRLLAGRLGKQGRYRALKANHSPVPPELRSRGPHVQSFIWQRLGWWLNDPVYPGWETRKETLLAAVWLSWLLFLIFAQTGVDYMHLTKRFGIVAASQLPVHYLLSAKGWSPIQYLTRMSHEELNPYHRLLGRIIVVLFSCHASLYLNFFIKEGLLLRRIQNRDVILGLTAITSMLVLGTSALGKIRNYSYRLFFYLHVAIATTILPVLYFHVHHVRIYVIETAFVFLWIILQRNLSQSTVPATIKPLKGTSLLSISIPLTSNSRFRDTKAGQHIYLGFASLPKKLIKNPFTISNSHEDGQPSLQLVIRSLDGTTSKLAKLAQQPQPIDLLVEGPYGSSKYFPQLNSYDRVLLIAGGVGATFILPLFLDLRKSMREGEVKMIWSVRSIEEIAWATEALFGGENGGEDVDVYLTGAKREESAQGVELAEITKDDGVGKKLRSGRPHYRNVVDETFTHDDGERIAVLVCGPSGMGDAVRYEVGKWVQQGRDIWWHDEQFGW